MAFFRACSAVSVPCLPSFTRCERPSVRYCTTYVLTPLGKATTPNPFSLSSQRIFRSIPGGQIRASTLVLEIRFSGVALEIAALGGPVEPINWSPDNPNRSFESSERSLSP